METSQMLCTILLILPAVVWSAQNDTLDQLKWGYTNVHSKDTSYRAPVTVDSGSIPQWLDGSFLRHACGAFGETGSEEPYLNKIDHLLDCLEMGQSYVFKDGEVTFTNQYYDTNAMDIYFSYNENMNDSSVYFGTVFASLNLTAIDKHRSDYNKPGKSSRVSAVSWWILGDKVASMTEYPAGNLIDVHEVEDYGGFPWSDTNLGYPSNVRIIKSPAHEQTEPDGEIWSTAGLWQYEDGSQQVLKMWDAVFSVEPGTTERVVIGENVHPRIDLSLCTGPGEAYPDPDALLRYMHAIQMTQNYIVLPETSYVFDPCGAFIFPNSSQSFFLNSYRFDENVDGVLRIMDKNSGEFVASIDIPPMFATHMLGAYEEGDLMHLDMLVYDNADIYLKVTYVDNALTGFDYDTYVTRYTVNMTTWTLLEMKDIMNNMPQSLEFSNINFAYQAKKYKFAYMIRNAIIINGAIIKLNVDDGNYIEYEMGEGQFPAEPWFVPSPGATEEDDGLILVQGVDGKKQKGFLLILDAKDLSLVSHVTAPTLTLFGLHGKFFPSHIGHRPDGY